MPSSESSQRQAGVASLDAVDAEAQLTSGAHHGQRSLPHSQVARQLNDVQDDTATFPFVFSDAYCSVINVAVGLLLATTGSFLASILTSFEPKLRSSRHYLGWALVCFTTTLLINLSQQIAFATATSVPNRTRQRTAVDIAVAECYLQDNLATWYTRLLCRSVYKKQRDTRKQREAVVKEREEAKQLRLRGKRQREAAYKQLSEGRLTNNEGIACSEEATLRADEAAAQLREAECQSQEAVLQSQRPVNSRRQELSRERERASRAREQASRLREEQSRQRETAQRELKDQRKSRCARHSQTDSISSHGAPHVNEHNLDIDARLHSLWQLEDDARQREESNRQFERALARQKAAQIPCWTPMSLLSCRGYVDIIRGLLQTGDQQDSSRDWDSSTWRIHRLLAFLALQKFACAQTIAFLFLIAGLALIGVTHIKIGLAAEGIFIIVITCGGKLIGLGPSTFVHFILVPSHYYD